MEFADKVVALVTAAPALICMAIYVILPDPFVAWLGLVFSGFWCLGHFDKME